MILRSILKALVYLFAKINLKRRVIIFDTTFGYKGHARACFEYLQKNYPHYKIYFITKKDVPSLRNAYSYYSLKGVLLTYLSKYQFYTVSAPIFQNLDKKVTVQFWHGTPIKALGAQDTSMDVSVIERMKFEFGRYSSVIVADENTRDGLVEGFSIDREVCVAATPYILRLQSERVRNLAKSQQVSMGRNFRIMYAPTFRPYSSRFWDLGKNEAWLRFCDRTNVKVQYSYHPSDPDSKISANDDILVALPNCELLITDYSSIFYDAMKIEVPTLLFQPDKELYAKARGFSQTFIDDNVGSIADTEKLCSEVLSQIKRLKSRNCNTQFNLRSDNELVRQLGRIGFE